MAIAAGWNQSTLSCSSTRCGSKSRDEGLVRNKAVYLAIGMRCSGHKEVLGLWIEQTEGAKFWLRVMNELRSRGLNDILIAVVDGLKGFPDAITSVYPDTVVQTCIVHLIRNSLQLASWKDRKMLAAALKPIYQADKCRCGRASAQRLRARGLGPAVSDDRPELASALGTYHPVLCLRRSSTKNNLHDQCD